jgi:outer membrane lipoprotein-sorting protein
MQNRTSYFVSRLAFCACAALISAAAQTPKPNALDAVLAQMNAASTKFTNAQADIRQDLYTKVVRDTDTKNGQIYFIRNAGSAQMGMKLFEADGKLYQQLQFKDNVGQLLTPGENKIDQFSATGKNQSTAQTIMTLGFGGSGTELKKNWAITDLGADTLDNVKVEKLDLVSKDPAISKVYSHIAIWLDPVRDVSLKQISYDASSGDTRTVTYTNIRLNGKIDTNAFQIKCSGKCTVVKH